MSRSRGQRIEPVTKSRLVIAVLVAGCSGVHARATETPEGPGYDLECPGADQCTQKAQKVCRSGFRIIRSDETSGASDGRHHWTVACAGTRWGSRLPLQQAKDSAMKLARGSSQEDVTNVFGPPTMTQPQTVVSNGSEWDALVWTYQWWVQQSSDCAPGSSCSGHPERLDLVFRRAGSAPYGLKDDGWRLESCSWRDGR